MKTVVITFLLLAIASAEEINDHLHIQRGLISDLLNKTINEIKEKLADFNTSHFELRSGAQEFGEFNVIMNDIIITGIDTTIAEEINVYHSPSSPLLPSSINVALHLSELFFETRGGYELTGQLIFPIGDKIVELTGNSTTFKAGLTGIVMNVTFDFAYKVNNTAVTVTNVAMTMTAIDMSFFMEEIMGGGDLGWAFNTVLDDVDIVVFNYYKDAIIQYYILDLVKKIANTFICQILPILCQIY